jgi:hypothetical protein
VGRGAWGVGRGGATEDGGHLPIDQTGGKQEVNRRSTGGQQEVNRRSTRRRTGWAAAGACALPRRQRPAPPALTPLPPRTGSWSAGRSAGGGEGHERISRAPHAAFAPKADAQGPLPGGAPSAAPRTRPAARVTRPRPRAATGGGGCRAACPFGQGNLPAACSAHIVLCLSVRGSAHARGGKQLRRGARGRVGGAGWSRASVQAPRRPCPEGGAPTSGKRGSTGRAPLADRAGPRLRCAGAAARALGPCSALRIAAPALPTPAPWSPWPRRISEKSRHTSRGPQAAAAGGDRRQARDDRLSSGMTGFGSASGHVAYVTAIRWFG